MELMSKLKNRLQLVKMRQQWKKKNRHNMTVPKKRFPIDKVFIGKYTYGEINVLSYNDHNILKIGNYCSIGPEVAFLLSADHNINCISSYPFKVKVLNEELEGLSKGDIIVDDDVWIGYGSIIMSGVHIGQGAIIAAGSVVTKNIPPYAIVGGVPSKIIRYRFNEALIQELLKVDFSKLDKALIEKHIDDLYEDLTDINQLLWMPKISGGM